MKKILLLTAASVVVSTLLVCVATAAEVTTQLGMEKIKNNAINAKKNKDEHSRNLQVVNGNLAEIKKNKVALQQQKKNVVAELQKNAEAFVKLSQQEKEITVLIGAEKEKLHNEEKQMEVMQTQYEQLKKNQEMRQALITHYQTQLTQAGARKNEWKGREASLKNQDNQTNEAIRNISSAETNWANKKSGYEKDTKHWTAESTNRQKIHDTYQGIAEGK